MLHKGNVIKHGVNTELDELRSMQKSGKEFLDNMLKREIKKTGITSLKISFNNVFGYYLEVRNRFKQVALFFPFNICAKVELNDLLAIFSNPQLLNIVTAISV